MADLDAVKVGDVVYTAQHEGITVTATVSRVEEGEYWAELQLKGSRSAEEWQANAVTDNFDAFAFGVWMDGPGLPVYWGDIDADGKPELLAPPPKGDLSPPLFRIFRWTGEDLLFLKKRALLAVGDGKFEWATLGEESVEADWIESFPDGKAEVLSLREGHLKRELIDFQPGKDGIRKAE